MATAVKIEGIEDCLRMFDRAPDNALKVCRKAMRVASRATSNHIKRGTPKRFAKLTKYKLMRTATKNISARIGLYANGKRPTGKASKDDPAFDWFKAYWANYGTMARRDPNHQFQYAVKPRSKHRRQSVGQRAQRFFEKSIKGWEDIFVEAFLNEVGRHENEILQ